MVLENVTSYPRSLTQLSAPATQGLLMFYLRVAGFDVGRRVGVAFASDKGPHCE
jgi:hypothetical protein